MTSSSSAYRSLTAISKKCFSNRPTLITPPKPIPSSPFVSPTTPLIRLPSTRFAAIAMLGSLETMLPLHSRIAAARLKSNIAIDSSCWSWLSLDFATPR